MKKVFLKGVFSIAALFIIFNTNAQVGIGVKGGLNLSRLANVVDLTKSVGGEDSDAGSVPTIENNFLLGGNFGAIISVKANDIFAVQAEFLYSSQGTKLSTGIGGLKFEAKLLANYFQLPVLAKVSFGSDKVKGFINAGPYLGYLLSSSVTGPFGEDGAEKTEKVDLSEPSNKEALNRMDVGVAAGVGVAIAAGPGDFIIEARYNYGFMDPIKTEPKPANYKAIHNSVVNFSAGYILYFGGK